ncbi:MAG: prepilin-type N-terminal cleavage/methylation domain-containing protein [Myxococcota bacterium]
MKRIARGFTLVELMIVVAIVAVLAAIALPNFNKFQCRAKQSEAKEILKGAYMVEMAYNAEFGTFVDVTALTLYAGLDWRTFAETKYYLVTSGAVSLTDFTITAKDDREPIQIGVTYKDTWELTSAESRPVIILDACPH